MSNRPASVDAAAILLYLGAAAACLGIVVFALIGLGRLSTAAGGAGPALRSELVDPPAEGVAEGLLIAGMLVLLVAVTAIHLTLGYRLQQGRRWARPAAIGYAALWIGLECVGTVATTQLPSVAALGYAIAIIILLHTHRAQSYFARPRRQGRR